MKGTQQDTGVLRKIRGTKHDIWTHKNPNPTTTDVKIAASKLVKSTQPLFLEADAGFSPFSGIPTDDWEEVVPILIDSDGEDYETWKKRVTSGTDCDDANGVEMIDCNSETCIYLKIGMDETIDYHNINETRDYSEIDTVLYSNLSDEGGFAYNNSQDLISASDSGQMPLVYMCDQSGVRIINDSEPPINRYTQSDVKRVDSPVSPVKSNEYLDPEVANESVKNNEDT